MIGIWSINVYKCLLDGYYKVMSNIPKMGHLPTPVSSGQECAAGISDERSAKREVFFLDWKNGMSSNEQLGTTFSPMAAARPWSHMSHLVTWSPQEEPAWITEQFMKNPYQIYPDIPQDPRWFPKYIELLSITVRSCQIPNRRFSSYKNQRGRSYQKNGDRRCCRRCCRKRMVFNCFTKNYSETKQLSLEVWVHLPIFLYTVTKAHACLIILF